MMNLKESTLSHFRIYCQVPDSEIEISEFVRDEDLLFATKLRRKFAREYTYVTANRAKSCGLMKHIHKNYRQPVKLVTARSIDLGCVHLNDIGQIKCDFDLSLDASGVVSILSADFKNELLIDFELSKDGRYKVITEIYGCEWCMIFDDWMQNNLHQ